MILLLKSLNTMMIINWRYFDLIGLDGNPKFLLVPVETKESTVVYPTPRRDEEEPLAAPKLPQKPERPQQTEFVVPPLPAPLVGPPKPTATVVVPHNEGQAHTDSLVAPLLVAVTIMGWWLLRAMKHKNKKPPVPDVIKVEVPVETPPEPSQHEVPPSEVKEGPVVTPVVGPSTSPERETVIIIKTNNGCCNAHTIPFSPPGPTTQSSRLRPFSDNAYQRAGQAFDVQ
jgi:hypothetical protein